MRGDELLGEVVQSLVLLAPCFYFFEAAERSAMPFFANAGRRSSASGYRTCHPFRCGSAGQFSRALWPSHGGGKLSGRCGRSCAVLSAPLQPSLREMRSGRIICALARLSNFLRRAEPMGGLACGADNGQLRGGPGIRLRLFVPQSGVLDGAGGARCRYGGKRDRIRVEVRASIVRIQRGGNKLSIPEISKASERRAFGRFHFDMKNTTSLV